MAHENRQPFLAMTACIALAGIYPSFYGTGGYWASTPFLGELRLFAGNQLPQGWSFCEGQLISIPTHQALFALLGTYYGGNGMTTFALPDLRGRIPIGASSANPAGASGGLERVTLATQHMPQHTHPQDASDDWGMDTDPEDKVPAASSRALYAPPQGTFDPGPVAGGSQPHDNMAPSLVLRWAIATQGVFPSQL